MFFSFDFADVKQVFPCHFFYSFPWVPKPHNYNTRNEFETQTPSYYLSHKPKVSSLRDPQKALPATYSPIKIGHKDAGNQGDMGQKVHRSDEPMRAKSPNLSTPQSPSSGSKSLSKATIKKLPFPKTSSKSHTHGSSETNNETAQTNSELLVQLTIAFEGESQLIEIDDTCTFRAFQRKIEEKLPNLKGRYEIFSQVHSLRVEITESTFDLAALLDGTFKQIIVNRL